MTDYQKEIGYYFADIRKYSEQKDYTSALIMARGLVKLLIEAKREDK